MAHAYFHFGSRHIFCQYGGLEGGQATTFEVVEGGHYGGVHFVHLGCPVEVDCDKAPQVFDGFVRGDDFKWFVGPRPYNRLGEGGAVSMAAGYFDFGLTDDETMVLEKRVNGTIHII